MKKTEARSRLAKMVAQSGVSRRKGPLALVQAIADGAAKSARRVSRVSDWHRMKATIIAERGPACEACPTVMPVASMMHLHHVLPKSQGGTDTRDNAALLCPNCHGKAHWLYRTLNRIAQSRVELFEMLAA